MKYIFEKGMKQNLDNTSFLFNFGWSYHAWKLQYQMKIYHSHSQEESFDEVPKFKRNT